MRSKLYLLLEQRELRPIDLARRVGVDKSVVTRWAARRIPAERVLDIESATGIPRHELRPDIYPPPTTGAAA